MSATSSGSGSSSTAFCTPASCRPQCARNAQAKRGHSRDHRPDCKQLVVGLVLNRDGFAITHEIFAGNAQDRTTLATMLDRLGERVDLKEGSTVVIDRGMAFDENIADIKKRKLRYG